MAGRFSPDLLLLVSVQRPQPRPAAVHLKYVAREAGTVLKSSSEKSTVDGQVGQR